jgi:hypothetical protein
MLEGDSQELRAARTEEVSSEWMSFFLGVVVGLGVINHPIPWLILLGVLNLGRLFYWLINGE